MNFNDLEVRYGQRLVIKNLNLEVYCGEILVLMGPNGAGKTTTIKIMVGLIKDFGGAYSFKNVVMPKSIAQVSRMLGYLPQGVSFQEEIVVNGIKVKQI